MPQKLTTTACFIQEESSSCIYIYVVAMATSSYRHFICLVKLLTCIN